MKIKIVLIFVFAAFMTLVISSYKEGPDFFAVMDCTGATGTIHGCSGSNRGTTCHSNVTTDNNVVIELDSAGTAVKTYYPGVTYTVKLSGTNGTGQTLPRFGFQMTAAFLAGSGDSATVRAAGNWDSAAISGNVSYFKPGSSVGCATCSNFSVPIIEHNTQIVATSGTGANGTTYVESFTWSAPASGSGSVVLYGVINAVNYDQTVTGDYDQSATDTLTEAIGTGIDPLAGMLSGFSVYPTLMGDNVTLAFHLKESSTVNVTMISMQGQVVRTLLSEEPLAEGDVKRSYDVSGLATGIYLVRLQIGGASLVTKVIKE